MVLEGLKQRARHIKVSGSRHYNPGWHYAIDLRAMLVVCEAIIRSAINREESRRTYPARFSRDGRCVGNRQQLWCVSNMIVWYVSMRGAQRSPKT